MKTKIRCKTFIDGTGDAPRNDVLIVIEDERIAAVDAWSDEPAQDEGSFLDLSGCTVMPGMMDLHCHLLLEGINVRDMYHTESSAAKAFRGLKNAQLALRAGFTTVRDPGDIDIHFAHLALRDAINRGWFDGPRIYAAGHYLSITGGHADLNDIAHEFKFGGFGRLVDSPDDMRKAVREEVKFGADWIKFFATGGILSAGDDPSLAHLTFEEMRVCVETAEGLGRHVAAHAHGTRGIVDAVRAGVRSIEHGTMLDEQAIALMLEKGTYLVPTAWVLTAMADGDNPMGLINDSFDKAKRMAAYHVESTMQAYRAGVPIVTGTDVGVVPHGGNANELVSLVRYGIKPMEVIVAATKTSAEMLEIADVRGTLKPGMRADLIAMAANPLEKIEAVLDVGFVMKEGKIYHDRLSGKR